MIMKITGEKALEYLCNGKMMNNGAWIEHSYYAGMAAGLIAKRIKGLDSERAKAYGFLHDIGRSFGLMQINHIFKGYYFLCAEGYPDAAQICLTHSFPVKDIASVTNVWDCSAADYAFMENYLPKAEYTLYDKLIQLCDNVASADGLVVLEKRMVDIVMRYGIDECNLLARWDQLFAIKKELEALMDASVEDVLGLKAVRDFTAEDLLRETIAYDRKKDNKS